MTSCWKQCQFTAEQGTPDTTQLFENLAAHNGMADIEHFVTDANVPQYQAEAARIFKMNAFVVIKNVLTTTEIEQLLKACEEEAQTIVEHDAQRYGNRGKGRYSFGLSSQSRQMLHRVEWVSLLQNQYVLPVVTDIMNPTPSTEVGDKNDFVVWGGGGDFVLGATPKYQPLHSDLGGLEATHFKIPPLLVVNYTVQELTKLNGPTRIIPATATTEDDIPQDPETEPDNFLTSTLCPLPAGCAIIRDARCWHGGTPNLTSEPRYLPNSEFISGEFRRFAPQGRCLPKHLWEQLPTELQQRTNGIVLCDKDEVGICEDTGIDERWVGF
eukprot:TRINITY_DN67768_c11_g1_i1.p1 TRINITY_DN67768_c11_g1~~TRINITY_DN67768_c11_g1_i1.p1  ORF type:complete len:326 (+),score=33.53 TRINITY_DN67768_c11_g1_i1:93-1070(+)